MPERSSIWNSTGVGDGAGTGITQQQWLEIFRDSFTSDRYSSEGVLAGVSGELKVSNSSSPLAVAAGAAYVYGFYYQNTASLNLTVTTPSVGTTGGHVVLRADWTTQTVRAVAVRNTDGTNSTPALTQTAGTTYEIRLCSFTITTGGSITVTDARDFCHPTALVYRRQGGSATAWNTSGSTNYTPGGTKIQAGAVSVSFSSSATSNLATVTFPSAFTNVPIALLSTFSNGSSTGRKVLATIESLSTTQLVIRGYIVDGSTTSSSFDIYWLAIGDE